MELDELYDRLERFCRARYQTTHLRVHDITTMPGHAGFAYGFAVEHDDGTDRWFLRLPPPNTRWRGTADMLRQVTALQALDGTDVPHCSVKWYGGPDDVEWFGSPYFVVPQLSGGDVIHLDGRRPWIDALSETDRIAMGAQAMSALTSIHAVDWRSSCDYLGAQSTLHDEVSRWDRFIERAADPEELRSLPQIRQMLLDQIPDRVDIGLCHGDFQFGNLYYSSTGTLEAVLDWELCGIGPVLTDLGWVSLFTEPEAWAHEGAVPRGLPATRELISSYQKFSGRDLSALAWFEALAAYKFAAIIGFNLALHRRGKRPDELWETISQSMPSLQDYALSRLGSAQEL